MFCSQLLHKMVNKYLSLKDPYSKWVSRDSEFAFRIHVKLKTGLQTQAVTSCGSVYCKKQFSSLHKKSIKISATDFTRKLLILQINFSYDNNIHCTVLSIGFLGILTQRLWEPSSIQLTLDNSAWQMTRSVWDMQTNQWSVKCTSINIWKNAQFLLQTVKKYIWIVQILIP